MTLNRLAHFRQRARQTLDPRRSLQARMALTFGLVMLLLTAGLVISNILGKLHLANRTQATLYALREGIANLDD